LLKSTIQAAPRGEVATLPLLTLPISPVEGSTEIFYAFTI
jgi:hypothetical protein